ncbi:hypothetical protein ACTQ46_01345 [Gallicola sp. Sow4_E12]|uniref:hypothetical protein n=1 Tax=Gallicola sp. Sow4_E12 TaxID=3438785 RepID=UPI003F8F3937
MMKLQNELLIRLITDATLVLALTAAIVITNLALPIKILLGLWLIIEIIAVYRSIKRWKDQ